jgi:formate dehydrogenase alpha subunit
VEKVNLTIDSKIVTVEQGKSILQAAKKLGIEIPHLCYREDLSPFSGCRLCVVEVERVKNLVASCSYPVSEGMVVYTNTPRVQKARRLIMELLLSDHPYDCMTCEKSGDCNLEKYAYQMGITSSRFKGEKHHYAVDLSNPFFERDYNKCILCGRCVTVDNQVQHADAIDFIGRGFDMKPGAAFDRQLQDEISTCVFCGQCVGVCPTGALMDKGRRFKGREWELTKVRTVCSFCGVGCNIELNVKEGKLVNVTSWKDSPVNRGRLCVKGRYGYDYVQHPDRLIAPMMRKGKKGESTEDFEKVSWDSALSRIAEKLSELKEKYGAECIGFLSSAKCTNEENFLLQKFARAVVGTNNIDHCARL